MEFSMKNFWDGSRRALARAITIVEDERDGWEAVHTSVERLAICACTRIAGLSNAWRERPSGENNKTYCISGKPLVQYSFLW